MNITMIGNKFVQIDSKWMLLDKSGKVAENVTLQEGLNENLVYIDGEIRNK